MSSQPPGSPPPNASSNSDVADVPLGLAPPSIDGAKAAGSALPPPPPPRATLPPVNQAASVPSTSASSNGIGSARPRWKGDIPTLETVQQKAPGIVVEGEALAIGTYEEEAEGESAEEIVSRSAPSWLLSLTVHLIILLVLALFSLPAGNGFKNLVLTAGMSDVDSDGLELDLATLEFEESTEAETDAIDDTVAEADVPDLFEPEEQLSQEIIAPDMPGMFSPTIDKPMFSGRSGAMREALMAMYGATPDTKQAVAMGLEWLARQQRSRGQWSLIGPYENGGITENACAATSMALIAFAGDGHTHLNGQYKKEVSRGVKYLVSQQDRSGYMCGKKQGHDNAYAQAQATIALCELYAMTQDSWLRPYAQRAIDYAFKSQGPNGGWRYNPGESGDLSVTGWYVMATQSALAGGLEVPEEKYARVSKFLDSVQVYNGAGYTYLPGRTQGTPAMTAEGLLCRQYLGWKRDRPEMGMGVKTLLQDHPITFDKSNAYYWYYATQVMHHYGGQPWREWNDVMKVKLPAAQVTQGRQRGSWSPQRFHYSSYGRLYTTCLNLYCLEVYYRHLPLYKSH